MSSYDVRAADENSQVQPLPGTRNFSLSVSHLTTHGGLDSPLITEEPKPREEQPVGFRPTDSTQQG